MIAEKVLPLTGGSATLGAAGREDRDVRMLAPGRFVFLFASFSCLLFLSFLFRRPFYLHVSNAQRDVFDVSSVSFAPDAPVRVTELHVLTPEEVDTVNAGATQKTKCYRALIRTGSEFSYYYYFFFLRKNLSRR